MANEAIPGWFRFEVLTRLEKVKRAAGSTQHYALCPAHDDQHASLGIKPGTSVSIVYHCQAGCDHADIRQALAERGVPEEYLGVYGTPEFESARARKAAPNEDRRKLDRIAGLLTESMTPAMLKVRVLAVIDGCEVPADKRLFLALAARAGVKQSQRYEAWAQFSGQVLCGSVRPEPVSVDHVVLAPPADIRQASQVSESSHLPETGKPFRKPERDSSGNRKTDKSDETGETSTAIEALRAAGLVA